MAKKLAVFVTAYGERSRVLKALKEVCGSLFGAAAGERYKHTDEQENGYGAELSDIQEKGHVSGQSDEQGGRYQDGQSGKQVSSYSDGQNAKKPEEYLDVAAYKLLEEMEILSHMLDSLPFSDRIHFDFSVVNDMKYYNGFVFRGFLDGICDGVLTGGQYDKMMARMARSSGAIGFAIYLDLLEQLPQARADFDVDVLLLYDSDTDSRTVAEAVQKLTEEGKTVSAQKGIPEKLRYRERVNLITDSVDKRGFLC